MIPYHATRLAQTTINVFRDDFTRALSYMEEYVKPFPK
jgi:hypothetical protein